MKDQQEYTELPYYMKFSRHFNFTILKKNREIKVSPKKVSPKFAGAKIKWRYILAIN